MCQIFRQCGSTALQKICRFTIRQSLFANRCHSWLGRSLALPFRPPTEVGVYEKRSLLFGLRVEG
jgi:hypothetical protein